jgi:hypothetical protein
MIQAVSLINTINHKLIRWSKLYYVGKRVGFSLARSRWSLEHTENSERIFIFGLIR